MLCVCVDLSLPADPSLTCRNVLSVLERVRNVSCVGGDIFHTPWMKLRKQDPDDSQCRIEYYLQTHPCASWSHVAGGCLRKEEDSALQAAKEWLKPDKGRGFAWLGNHYIPGSLQHLVV